MGRRLRGCAMLERAAIAALVLVATAAPAWAREAPRMVGAELVEREPPQLIPDVYGGAEPRREEPPLTATPRADCGPGSRPSPGLQGRVPAGSAQGFTCNAELVGTEGATGGFKVERFVDRQGRVCGYYDTALFFPFNVLPDVRQGSSPGVAVLDMEDPTRPVRTATLTTPAMLSPHESLLVNRRRGLLAAAAGNLAAAPGVVDIYDIAEDCRDPRLLSSTATGILGHESGFAPDGDTFYVTSLFTGTVVAIDVRDPRHPSVLGLGSYPSHGLSVSDDGDRGYVAGLRGLQVIDLSEVQARRPDPQVRKISGLSWDGMSIPQTAIPVTIGGTPMLVETDEYSYDDGVVAANGPDVGAARIIDISDERAPRVVANLRLEVHQREHRATVAGDPTVESPAGGYAAHYCGVPKPVDPGIVACSSIASGLRVFDIRDPYRPRELAYYVGEPHPLLGAFPVDEANYAMSRPAFDPARGDIWYSDGNAGFRVVRLTNGVWPFPATGVTGLPDARRCLSRRVFDIRLRPRDARLRGARVTVAGRRVAVRRRGGRLVARVDLRGRPRQTVVVRVRVFTAGGRTIRETRRYRTCTRRPART